MYVNGFDSKMFIISIIQAIKRIIATDKRVFPVARVPISSKKQPISEQKDTRKPKTRLPTACTARPTGREMLQIDAK